MNKTIASIALCALALTGCATSETETTKIKDDALNDLWSIRPGAQTVVKSMIDSKSKVCGTEYNYEQVLDVARKNPAYAYLTAVNVTSKGVGEIVLSHLDQTVDCNDNDQWIANVRDYLKSDEYREIALKKFANQ
ncbi:hypothetical protein REH81_17970 [Vibrio rotiferianus]